MPKTDAFDDQEVRKFLDSLPRTMTYTEMAVACLEQFGPRAWSRSKIIRYRQKTRKAPKGQTSKADADQEVALWLEDRLDLQSLDEIAEECRRVFGDRAPSRSSIHRHFQKLRKALREADAE